MAYPKTDAVYDQLRDEFGDASPKASGYLSERSFVRERGFVLDAVGDAPGTVVDVACGGGLVSAPLVAAGRRVVGMDFNAGACRCAKSASRRCAATRSSSRWRRTWRTSC